jgi:hypothetical protein
MKLSPERIERTLDQFEAEPIPEDHPAVAKLNQRFGDHTYFLDEQGLLIVEPAEPMPSGAAVGQVVKLASWTDAAHVNLAPHEPEPTEVIVVLDAAA